MPDLTIPEAAVEAAFAKYSELDARNLTFDTSYVLRHVLNAAAPRIAAQALRDAANLMDPDAVNNPPAVAVSLGRAAAELVAGFLYAEADRIEANS